MISGFAPYRSSTGWTSSALKPNIHYQIPQNRRIALAATRGEPHSHKAFFLLTTALLLGCAAVLDVAAPRVVADASAVCDAEVPIPEEGCCGASVPGRGAI